LRLKPVLSGNLAQHVGVDSRGGSAALAHHLRSRLALVPTEYSVRLVAIAVASRRLIPFSASMTALLVALSGSLRATIHARFELAAEILALRHQLAVLQRTTPKRPRLRRIDRLVWVLLSRVWPDWRRVVMSDNSASQFRARLMHYAAR
jgi:hypothetical protein